MCRRIFVHLFDSIRELWLWFREPFPDSGIRADSRRRNTSSMRSTLISVSGSGSEFFYRYSVAKFDLLVGRLAKSELAVPDGYFDWTT
jgi:hypothetical protein